MSRFHVTILGFVSALLFAGDPGSVVASEPVRRDGGGVAKRIDAEIGRRLVKLNVSPAPLAGDAEFLRRVYLDITGRLPTADRAAEFLASKDGDKRTKLIDELLASPEYGKNFARYWTELFVKRDGELNKNMKTTEFRTWLAGEFNEGVGWDRIVTKMLTVDDSSPSGFFLRANRLNGERPSPQKIVGTVGTLFMGVQHQCAECHDHPFTDGWTQEGFWSMAAFFGRTRYENTKNRGEVRITEDDPPEPDPNAKNKKVIKVPVGGLIEIPDPLDAKKIKSVVKARYLDGAEAKVAEKGPHRPLYAQWLTEPKNPYFARAAVNRLWSVFFAKGLINPLDDMNPKNPSNHPELLTFLAEEFVASGHDYRHIIRSICTSDAYQRSSRRSPTDPDDDNFGRRTVQFLHGETLLTCLDQVLGVEPPAPPKKGRGEPNVAPTTAELFDSGVYDDDPSNYSFGAPQMLRLMNTDIPRRAPAAVARLLSMPATNEKYLERLYLMTLARLPSNEEARSMLAHVAAAESPAKGFEAVLWVLLNSAEFVSNH